MRYCKDMHALPGHACTQGMLKGKYHCTVDLPFEWFRISCMTIDNFCFYLQNRLIQTSQTGGQQYSDTSPFSIPGAPHHLTGVYLQLKATIYII
jgi:hypothetical protein